MNPSVTFLALNRSDPSISSFFLNTNFVGTKRRPLLVASCRGTNSQPPLDRTLLNSAVMDFIHHSHSGPAKASFQDVGSPGSD